MALKMFRKIDLYVMGDYYRSTNQSKTLKDAKARLIEACKENAHRLGGQTLTEAMIVKYPQSVSARFAK